MPRRIAWRSSAGRRRIVSALALAGCGSPYEGLWQTDDRTITLALEDGVAKWNVYLGRAPNATDDNTGLFRLLQGAYTETDSGLQLSLRCVTGDNAGCVDPASPIPCTRDGGALTCTQGGTVSRFGRVAD